MHRQAGKALDGGGHPPHDLTDPAQLRDHLAAAWGVMRDNRPVMTALFESSMAAGPATGALWERLTADTSMLREHLDYLQARGHALPGDPALIAAAIGGLLSMLAYALLPPTHRPRPLADRATLTPRSWTPSPACYCTAWPAPPTARHSRSSRRATAAVKAGIYGAARRIPQIDAPLAGRDTWGGRTWTAVQASLSGAGSAGGAVCEGLRAACSGGPSSRPAIRAARRRPGNGRADRRPVGEGALVQVAGGQGCERVPVWHKSRVRLNTPSACAGECSRQRARAGPAGA